MKTPSILSVRSLHLTIILCALVYMFLTGRGVEEPVALPLLFSIDATIAFVLFFLLGWVIAAIFSMLQIWQLRRRLYQVDKMIKKLNTKSTENRERTRASKRQDYDK